MLTPWIRNFNYIQDYYSIVYKIYSECYIASYPVTYYSINMEKSIFDDELNTFSYLKDNVGSLSGIRFNKISMFPVYGIEQIRPTFSSSEKGGITYSEGVLTKIVFPSVYGLKPLEGDYVDLSFGYGGEVFLNNMIYLVNSVSIVHQGVTFQLYQLDLRVSNVIKSQLEQQVVEDFMFYEFNKRILPLSNVTYLLKIYKRLSDVSNSINSLFDNKTGFYIFRR